MAASPPSTEMSLKIADRARQLESIDRQSVASYVDRIFALLLPIQWFFTLPVAIHFAPVAWEGFGNTIPPHPLRAVTFCGLVICVPIMLAILRPGTVLTRHAVAVGQMLIVSLLIHLSRGRTETHFYFLCSLPLLALYRDRRVLITATVVAGADLLIRGTYWPLSIFGTSHYVSWRWMEHLGWILFEDFVLFVAGAEVHRKSQETALRQAELEATREKIEQKVAERTIELKRAYEELEQQVNERERAERGRKGAEQRSVSILEAVVDGIITFDDKGVIESHNPAAARIFGDSRGELTGARLGSLIPEFAGEGGVCDVMAHVSEKRGDTSPSCPKLAGLRRDGTTFPVELSISRFSINDRIMFTATVRDITDRKVIEEQLASSDRERREIMEAIPDMICVLNKDGCLVNWNKRVETITGLSPDELMGRSAENFFDDESRWAIKETIRRTFQTGFGEVEADVLRPGGPPIPHQLVTAPLRNEAGEVIGLAGVGRDVTERKRVEEELRKAHSTLEERVFERTAELEWTNESMMNEVAERRRVEQELRIGEQRLRFQADAMPQIVWTARPDGVTDYFNRRWYEYTGIDIASTEPARWPTMIHPDDRERARRTWKESIESGADYQCEYRLRAKETGEFRWQLGRAVALRDANGAVVQWVGTCTDIDDQKHNEEVLQKAHDHLELRVRERTVELQNANELMRLEVIDRRKAEEEALQARAIAEAATRAKSEFLANVSHEIRTPMNGVIGMTELALDTELSPRQREYLDMVRSSAESLMTLINDILDFSKIEAEQLDLDPIPFEIRVCLEETLHTLALRAHAKGIELACRIDSEVPAVLIGDANRLRQVVVNLVGNAIKFTERGEVFVSVESKSLGESSIELKIAVRDTGIGIPLDKQRRIFEPFEQADGSTTRTYGGTGLGLAIATKLVDLMGGSIAIDSEVGRGSTFSFTAILGKTSEAAAIANRQDISLLAELPILIVDDNATNRRILEEVLRNWGATPTTAADGPEALAILRRAAREGSPFKIGLIDVMMPGMDGITLAATIRQEPAIAGITLLILTSAGITDDAAKSRALGLKCFLSKPVRQSELLQRVLSCLGESPDPGNVRETSTEVAESNVLPGPRSARSLHVLLADDHPVNQKMVARMLERMGHTSVIASDGRAAVEQFKAHRFDIVLMDIHMPIMDGFEAVVAIRAAIAEGCARTPIIAVTAHAMIGDRERCLARGFDGYLSKPIRSNDLHQTLESHALKPAPEIGAERESEEQFSGDSESSLAFEWFMRRLVERCGDDLEFAKELLESFLESAPRSVESIIAAREAENCEALAMAVHGFKGACLTLVADDLAAACRSAEIAALNSDFAAASASVDAILSEWARFKSALPVNSGVST